MIWKDTEDVDRQLEQVADSLSIWCRQYNSVADQCRVLSGRLCYSADIPELGGFKKLASDTWRNQSHVGPDHHSLSAIDGAIHSEDGDSLANVAAS